MHETTPRSVAEAEDVLEILESTAAGYVKRGGRDGSCGATRVVWVRSGAVQCVHVIVCQWQWQWQWQWRNTPDPLAILLFRVHIYGMDDRLAKTVNHHTHIAVLKRNVAVTDEQRGQLEAFALKVRGRGYEHLMSGDLCHAALAQCACCADGNDGHSGGQEWVDGQQEAMFCSELAACALGSIGTLKLGALGGELCSSVYT